MFDFEKLDIYTKAKAFNVSVSNYLHGNKELNHTIKDQLRRASFSIMLNIAEGSSRFSKADRKNFFVIARGSVFECAAIFDFLITQHLLTEEMHKNFYGNLEEISKMLFAMIKNLMDTK
jgi:four helix bundle protein